MPVLCDVRGDITLLFVLSLKMKQLIDQFQNPVRDRTRSLFFRERLQDIGKPTPRVSEASLKNDLIIVLGKFGLDLCQESGHK